MWFEPVSTAIQRWQELFVMSCLRDESLDDMVASTMYNLGEAHRPTNTCPLGMLESQRYDSLSLALSLALSLSRSLALSLSRSLYIIE
jgi:hypothetical protein